MAQLITINQNNFHESISRAVSVLDLGGIVAFPTDTVYGVGVDAFNPKAVEKIYAAKGRQKNKPLPVLVASFNDVLKISANLPPVFEKLATAFWPGALTIVVEANSALPAEITAGRNTVGVRMPDNPIALKLIENFGNPLATTSANISGEREAVTAEEVQVSLGDKIEMILDGGATIPSFSPLSQREKGGIVSTVLDLSVTPPVIRRRGQIAAGQIADVLCVNPSVTSYQ
ncbi:threonylcarbamoyl-AMP synthase [Candidatus Poribacteria bacterium]|nr:threonylcarbamoyl-AMP synthase [Candidatus Poribacteria bacterium]